MTFDVWVRRNRNRDRTVNDLSKLVDRNRDAWRSVASPEQAKAAIQSDVGSSDEEKSRLIQNLDRLWRDFAAYEGDDTAAAQPTPGDGWRTFLTGNAAMMFLLTLVAALLIAMFWLIADPDSGAEAGDGFLDQLAKPDVARGLITFVFAIGTVGVALILTAAAFAVSGDNQEEMKERFDMGKQVLTALIGIFGTILGFYFGSLDVNDSDRQSAAGPEPAGVVAPPDSVPNVGTPGAGDANGEPAQ